VGQARQNIRLGNGGIRRYEIMIVPYEIEAHYRREYENR
jgi:hypothetical protein